MPSLYATYIVVDVSPDPMLQPGDRRRWRKLQGIISGLKECEWLGLSVPLDELERARERAWCLPGTGCNIITRIRDGKVFVMKRPYKKLAQSRKAYL